MTRRQRIKILIMNSLLMAWDKYISLHDEPVNGSEKCIEELVDLYPLVDTILASEREMLGPVREALKDIAWSLRLNEKKFCKAGLSMGTELHFAEQAIKHLDALFEEKDAGNDFTQQR